jgi:hypothetical protein
MHLVDYARRVVMVVRGRELGDRMSQYLVKRIRECTDHGQCIEVLTEPRSSAAVVTIASRG